MVRHGAAYIDDRPTVHSQYCCYVIVMTWEEVEASAQDRQTWRQRVALCIGDAG